MMNTTIDTDIVTAAVPDFAVPPGIRRVVVVLIKPTRYDEDGFPYTFARGVLPSNSLAVLYSLTRQELARRLNGFWRDYGRQRWQLLLNPFKYVWHLKMIPYAITEVVYSVRFAAMMLRVTRKLLTT